MIRRVNEGNCKKKNNFHSVHHRNSKYAIAYINNGKYINVYDGKPENSISISQDV